MMTDPTAIAGWLADQIVRTEAELLPLQARLATLRECLDQLTTGAPAESAEPDPFAPTTLAAQPNRVNAPPPRSDGLTIPPDEPNPHTSSPEARTGEAARQQRSRTQDAAHNRNGQDERVEGHAPRVALEEGRIANRIDPRSLETARKVARVLDRAGGQALRQDIIGQEGLSRPAVDRATARHEWFEAYGHGGRRLTDKGRVELLEQASEVGEPDLLPARRKIAAVLRQHGSGLSYETIQVRTGLAAAQLSEALDGEFFRRESGKYILTPPGNRVLREE